MNASFTIALEDGTRVLMRPVRPEDRTRFLAGLEHVSMASRHTRFFAAVRTLTEQQLRYLTEVDQVDHVAWGALDPEDAEFPGYGVGRFVRTEEDPDIAEIAVLVIDDRKGSGLGTVFLALLYLLAESRGIRALTASILPENRFMVDWVREVGGEDRVVSGVLQLVLPVLSDLSDLPDTPRARRFRRVLEEVREKLFGLE